MAERVVADGLAWQPLYTGSDRPVDPGLQAAARSDCDWQTTACADTLAAAAARLAEGFDRVRVGDPALVRALAAGDIAALEGLPPASITVALPVDANGAAALRTLATRHPPASAVADIFDVIDGLPPASAVALALAAGVELLRACGDDAARAAPGLCLPVSIGSEVATEISKLRAARATWRAVHAAFGAPASPARLFARADRAGWTAIDAHGNLIRGALAAFAATAGGADQIEPLAFDPHHAPVESRRLALNQLHLLRHEAALARVHDPAAGSYAIEAQTHALAQAAWRLFQQVEAAGGFAKAPLDALLGLSAARAAHAAAVRAGERVLVGVNRFADPRASLTDVPDDATDARAARPFEALRARTDALASRPRAVLLPYGAEPSRRAAAEFAAEFLRLAGIEVDDQGGFADVNAMAAVLAASPPALTILCGDLGADGRFVRDALPALRAVAPTTLFYATGHAPTGSERWGHVGFLHDGLDALGTLAGIVTRFEEG